MDKEFLHIKMFILFKGCGEMGTHREMAWKDVISKVQAILGLLHQALNKALALIPGITEEANIKGSSLKVWCMINMVESRPKVVLSTVESLSWEKDKVKVKFKLWMVF